ncbi:hypothetical protein PVAND_003000 [Polypedilum vanderplanki]|uniref:BAT2 N-terminal domain-containing protein n=1 Tax=Polypedilum vanderplanki TaxID=319348 RepID=A0A9J6BT76_POLVA|nr:hypothetical protein PVAND_003000 [Polypedilum vanderplanki]
MSTLGGNKGERNPNKPKFAALDINSLYRSSRGETFEPTTQKNAAPRKHGMQSLGKVPSARRPPANLPSLKAETSTPSTNTPSQTTNNEPQVSANSTSASWADSGSTQTNATNVTSNSQNLSNSAGQINQQGREQQNQQSGNSSWSAVATGNVSEDSASQPPLYQSPQFQNEFPSLDGAGTMNTSTSSNVSAMTQKSQSQNSFDSGGGSSGLNLRPSTDAASWMQQQQSNLSNSGNARGVGGENGPQQSQQGSMNNFNPTADLGPPKVMALMPSFLRGNAGIGSSPPSMAHSSTRDRGERNDRRESGLDMRDNSMQKSNMDRGNRSGGGGGRNALHYDRSSYNNDYSNNGLPPRHIHNNHHHRQAPPRRQNNMNNINSNSNNNNNSDERSSSYEPEIIMQRPIIKEEELERIDSLARDDAWSKHDEIDYNKKLQFSDDETDDVKPKDLNNDKKVDAWREEKREKQNGPRSIEPSYIEKMKMKREEEERIERERINAAQRKLQELDEKSKQKQISLDKSQEKDVIEEKTTSGLTYTINDSDKKLDYGKSKYQINDKYDTYDQYGRNANITQALSSNASGEFKKSQFQSNLPPRFQKQQQHIERQDDRREKPSSNNYKPLHQQDSKNIPFAQYEQQQQQSQQSQQQQRWNQYNKTTSQQTAPPRRNMSSLSQSSSDDNRQQNSGKQSYNRRRQESEEDDYQRFGKESSSMQQQQQQQQKKSTLQTAQITRSMSDSSDKLSDHNRSEKSTSREYLTNSNVCWAEVCENDKRSSLDTKDRRRVSESSAISDDQPRTILQRNKPLQEQLQGKDVKKETKDEEKSVLNDSSQKNVESNDEKIKNSEQQSSSSVAIDQTKKSLDIIPEKDQILHEKADDTIAGKKETSSKSKESVSKESDDNKSGTKRSPHSNRYDSSSSRGGRGSGNYNSGGYRGNWQQRRGGHSRGGRYEYSDSENSEECDNDWNGGRGGHKSSSLNRKDATKREHFNIQKEGFSPRGEPSRRGRGGGLSGSQSSSNFRRTGSNNSNSITAPIKRIDNYGPPSSKSPFGSTDEKFSSDKRDSKERDKLSDDDRTKQKQKALSDALLLNKNVKDSSNLAMQKSTSPSQTAGGSIKSDDITKQQHSTESLTTTSTQSNQGTYDQKDKKSSESDDKAEKASSGSRANSSSSYNANQNRQSKHDTSKVSSSGSSKTISKPSSISNQDQVNSGKMSTNMSSSSNQPVSSSSLSQSSQKSMIDSRNTNNSANYRNDQRGNAGVSNASSGAGNGNLNANVSGNNRMAPRFAKQQRDVTGPGSNRMSGGNYWDKNHSEGLHDETAKVSLMQQHLGSSGSMAQQQQHQQQLVSSNSNILNSKTDVMKQQPNASQMSTATNQQQAPMLDGASLPKQTLIFENTSYKSAPPSLKRPPSQQQQQVLGQGSMNQKDTTPTINEMIEQQAKDHSLSSALQNLSFGQKPNDMVDMNFKFSFDTQLTDDGNSGFGSVTSSSSTHPSQTSKASSLGLVGAKTGMQNSNILNTDALNMKVASCKKVWEEPSVDHSGSNADDVMANFVAQQHMQYSHNNITAHHTGLSPQSFGYATSSVTDHTSSLEHFNKSNDNDDSNSYPSPQQHMSAHVMQQANLSMKAAEVFASANVCKVKPTQQQMHQSGLSSPPQLQQSQMQQHQQTFYPTPNYPNIPTIPSPPVVYNSQATTSGLYNPYNMDAARAQMYSYQTGNANNSLSFNAFMQTPNIASAPTHEMYQNLPQYRAAVQSYNQTPQLNNPNAAVLISSATASNSMMGSKSNAPQQIGAIGSKSSAPQSSSSAAAAAGQYNPQYMNHVYHHQNNYYPNSTAQQANAYYNATGTAPASGGYGIFSGTNAAPQQQPQMNYGSVGQYPINSQMLNNLVYRGGPVMNNSNGSSASGSNSNSGATTGGYMKQQQQHQQSQLQDPTSLMKFSNANQESNYFSTINLQNNYSQFSSHGRTTKKYNGSAVYNPNQGKSQYFTNNPNYYKREDTENL